MISPWPKHPTQWPGSTKSLSPAPGTPKSLSPAPIAQARIHAQWHRPWFSRSLRAYWIQPVPRHGWPAVWLHDLLLECQGLHLSDGHRGEAYEWMFIFRGHLVNSDSNHDVGVVSRQLMILMYLAEYIGYVIIGHEWSLRNSPVPFFVVLRMDKPPT